MRRHPTILTAGALMLSLALAGCETFWDRANTSMDRVQDALADFNPFGTAKKPLPGERRPVFPEGVPGVQQGVPSELMRDNQQAGDPQAQPPPPAEPAPAATKSKRTAKTKAQAPAPAAGDQSDPPDDAVWPPPPTR